MHELSIATQLLDEVIAIASEHNAVRIAAIALAVGAMEQVVPEALETAFAVVSQGTVAESAQLTIREAPVRAVCRGCGRRYAATIGCYVCPACGQADPDIVEGRGIVLMSLDCVTEEDADHGES